MRQVVWLGKTAKANLLKFGLPECVFVCVCVCCVCMWVGVLCMHVGVFVYELDELWFVDR